MKNKYLRVVAFLLCAFQGSSAFASELSYTFLDFEYLDQTVDVAGSQMPAVGQNVSVLSDTGDGIGIGGSLGLGGNFFLAGRFLSSIVEVTNTVTSPSATTVVDDDYDLINSQLRFGYIRPFGDDFDLVAEITYDSSEYDFGSIAGENLDVDDAGVGARIGFRWNPTPAIEVYANTRFSPVGEVSLDRLEFDSDTIHSAGLIWYFFEDLGLGFDYASGQVDSFSVSMRFSFGTLQW
jgi:hypothetical protein